MTQPFLVSQATLKKNQEEICLKLNDAKIWCQHHNAPTLFLCPYRPVALRLQSSQQLKWSNWTLVSQKLYFSINLICIVLIWPFQ